MRYTMNKIPTKYELPRAPDWQDRAACRGSILTGAVEDREVFPFPNDKPATTDGFIAAYCDRCPIRRECLQFALDNGYDGVWGGRNLTAADLRAYRRLINQDVLSSLSA